MARQWLRRARLLAACASVLAIVACGGGGETESKFDPSRIVAFGDAFADLGQNGARYTVNDGSVNNWTQFVAREYDLPLAPTATGGQSYAIGNARAAASPDAAGNPATPTVQQQVTAFLAASTARSEDLVIVNAGHSDVILQAQNVINGTLAASVAEENVGRAGRDLAAQVRRLVGAGAKHVVVVGPYNLGVSAWAEETKRQDLLEELSRTFNDELKVALVNFGSTVLYIDAALHFNLVTSAPSAYELDEDIVPACTSVDPGPGIGTGVGEVNSNRCTPATLRAGVDENRLLFADRVYMTPVGHRLLGEYAVERIRSRW
ncbi:MAG: esterase-like protein [Ramlibacter sp.]|jgi:outer membrane lipase/esterase|uniref:SGNH/GDSL hydrolase family protein n=1 Tax=Ramlibacter sp. TaxID=1917967 RepID=UPI00260E8502|nr:SGNH/GDSL hydrolase family protein [Ramlibacter sp.]MDB5752927.1 esterase-like protein [Ramlibacter sp.]